MFNQIIEQIKNHDTIIIHRHSKPDGDALGSQIGLKHLIKHNFPNKKVFVVGDMTERYSFINDCVMDEIDDSVYNGALAFVLDLSAPHLVSDDRYKLAKTTVRFDHHLFIEKFCDFELVDSTFESCAGLISYLAKSCNLLLNEQSASALYTGMVTDSGRFRYDSTTSRTFEVASFLLTANFSLNDIYVNLYADDFEFIKLRASFILKINFTDKKVGYIYTTKEEMQALNKDSFTISRGMVNTMSDLKGVDIWVNFTEADGVVLCEIRSSKYNINPIAVKYGGGGHAKASGATLPDKQTAMALLSDLNDLICD